MSGSCNHCGHEPVATNAPTCPRCGGTDPNNPIVNLIGFVLGLIFSAVGWIVYGLFILPFKLITGNMSADKADESKQAASSNASPQPFTTQQSAEGKAPSSRKTPMVVASGCGALLAGVMALVGLLFGCSGVVSLFDNKPKKIRKITVAELASAAEKPAGWMNLSEGQLLLSQALKLGKKAEGEKNFRSVSAFLVPLRASGTTTWRVMVQFEAEDFEKRFPNLTDPPASFSSTCEVTELSESRRDLLRSKYPEANKFIVVKPGTPPEPLGVGGSVCMMISGLGCSLLSVAVVVGAIMMMVRNLREKPAPASNAPQAVASSESPQGASPPAVGPAPRQERPAWPDPSAEPQRERPAAPVQAPPPPPAVPESQWYLHQGGKTYGPMTATQMRSLVHSGRLGPQDFVCQMGSQQWIRAGTAQDIFPQRT